MVSPQLTVISFCFISIHLPYHQGRVSWYFSLGPGLLQKSTSEEVSSPRRNIRPQLHDLCIAGQPTVSEQFATVHYRILSWHVHWYAQSHLLSAGLQTVIIPKGNPNPYHPCCHHYHRYPHFWRSVVLTYLTGGSTVRRLPARITSGSSKLWALVQVISRLIRVKIKKGVVSV